MLFANPYSTIFNDNYWFFNNETKKLFYSDSLMTMDKIYLHIPFKNDQQYNKKLIIYFNKFMSMIAGKITKFNKGLKVSYFAQLDSNHQSPVILCLKPMICTETWIKIPWELVEV